MKTTLCCCLALSALMAAAADAPRETRAHYATNPDGAVGQPATITIDGEFDDWSESMIIALCGANDEANAFKGSHENCVLDAYALYAAWDDSNLYMAWQMCNSGDTWAREGDGPLTDYGRIGDVPLILSLSVNPAGRGMSGKLENGNFIWGESSANGVDFSGVHADHLLFMSGKAGQGEPAMFTPVNDKGATNYGAGCATFRNSGIKYAMKEGFHPSHYWRQKTTAQWSTPTTLVSDPSVVDNIYDADNYDNLLAGPVAGLKPHDTKFDSFYEIAIPLKALGITRQWLEQNGIGARLVATRGESGLDCVPFDPSMMDNALGEYGKDPSTTHEKDDIDLITYALADVARVRDLASIDPLPEPEPDPVVPTPEPGDGVYTVYFRDSQWNAPMVWLWDDTHNFTGGTWPGVAMVSTTLTDGQAWTFSFATDVVLQNPMVIFNQNGQQTADLAFVNNGLYNRSGVVSIVEVNALDTLEADSADIPAEYFTLDGQRLLQAPASGLVLRRRGSKVEKIAVR